MKGSETGVEREGRGWAGEGRSWVRGRKERDQALFIKRKEHWTGSWKN